MQLSCALLDGCTESSEQLCLPVSRLQGYTDTADVSRKAGRPEVAYPLEAAVLVVKAGPERSEPLHLWMRGRVSQGLVDDGRRDPVGAVGLRSFAGELLRATGRNQVVGKPRHTHGQLPVDRLLGLGWLVELQPQRDSLHAGHPPSVCSLMYRSIVSADTLPALAMK